jgi:hypothetical protein
MQRFGLLRLTTAAIDTLVPSFTFATTLKAASSTKMAVTCAMATLMSLIARKLYRLRSPSEKRVRRLDHLKIGNSLLHVYANGVRAPSWIIDDKDIVKVSKVYPKDITTEDQLVDILAETEEWREEWAAQILQVIKTYDTELTVIQEADEARRKRAKTKLA